MVFGEEIEYERQRDFDDCGKVEIDQVRPKKKVNYLQTRLTVIVLSYLSCTFFVYFFLTSNTLHPLFFFLQRLKARTTKIFFLIQLI